MSAPPLSKFLQDGTDLPSSGALAVRVERDGDGVRVILRDKWGWFFIAYCGPAEIDGRRGYSGVAVQQETPEAFCLPGETPMREPEGGAAVRGLAPKVPA